jgi:hypothetical protein
MKMQFRGKVYLGVRDNDGKPGPMKFVGCADALAIAMSVETFEHTSKCDSNDAIDFRGTKSQSAEVSLTLTELSKDNLKLALLGDSQAASSPGTVTGEALPSGIVTGDRVILGGATPHQTITGLVLTDTGSPGGTLVAGTDYTLDAEHGTVEFLTTPDGDVEADYGYTDLAYVSMFTAGAQEYWLRFDNVNKADADEPGVVDLYRVRLEPLANLDLLSDELAQLELSGAVLVDDKKSSAGALGQFGRITYPAGA